MKYKLVGYTCNSFSDSFFFRRSFNTDKRDVHILKTIVYWLESCYCIANGKSIL